MYTWIAAAALPADLPALLVAARDIVRGTAGHQSVSSRGRVELG